MIKLVIILFVGGFFYGVAQESNNLLKLDLLQLLPKPNNSSSTNSKPVPCICGIFLSGQFDKKGKPTENAIFLHENDENLMCNSVGNRQCINRCLEVLAKHLGNSATLICSAIDRDCVRERAHLFIKNCNDQWINSNLSAGREICCKDGEPYKCPIM